MTEHRLRTRWQKEDEAAIEAAINALLAHSHGRKLLWWLLQIGRVGQQPYSNNALNTSFNCGELNVGQQILDRITSTSPDGYVEMMKEAADERRRRDADLANERDGRRDDDNGDGNDGADNSVD